MSGPLRLRVVQRESVSATALFSGFTTCLQREIDTFRLISRDSRIISRSDALISDEADQFLFSTGSSFFFFGAPMANATRYSGGRERLVFFIDLHDDKQGMGWPTLATGSKG